MRAGIAAEAERAAQTHARVACNRSFEVPSRLRSNKERARSESSPRTQNPHGFRSLTVGLLEASARTAATELLGLAAAGVGDKQATVVLHEGLLDVPLALLVNVLLVEGDDPLGDGLAHRCATREKSVSIRVSASLHLGNQRARRSAATLLTTLTEAVG